MTSENNYTTMNRNLILLTGLALSQLMMSQTKKQQDQEAIKAMAGCYNVTFNYAETFSPDKEYQFKDNKRTGGLEWVEVVEDNDDKIMLQHLLIVGKPDAPHIVKHWRQDWLYENTNLLDYDADNSWKSIHLNPNDVKGQWTQKVYQVDDSPRYEGSATWIHYDGRHYWENTTYAPLPRREHTTRNDYNIMKRRNRQELMDFGWVHEQDNDKILRQNGEEKTIAQEKGWNTYEKVEDAQCKAAQDYWKKNAAFWATVRDVWAETLEKKPNIKLQKKIDNKPLYAEIFGLMKKDLDEKQLRKALKKSIKQYMH
ncbi:hypothetical protein UJ101_00743 [Flavobacteriaceae bacterium UJ101]|nr:hypothetical protein UJ101_00743 [Flavobacteriaceae bacterium UJ101]